MRITLSLLLVVAACGDNLPASDDGGDDQPEPATGRTLTGGHVIYYKSLDGATLGEETVDFWDTLIEAHVPDGDSWTIMPGIGHRDGSFEIPGLPEEGSVWLRFASRPFGDDFYWTDGDHMSLDELVLGPADPPRADEGDQIRLAVDGLSPWQDTDALAWFVPGQVVFDTAMAFSVPPATGTTDLAGTGVDWWGRPLADVTPGQPAFLVQYRLQTLAPGLELYAPLRSAKPTGFHQVAGASTTLTATVAPSSTLPYHMAIARDAFEAARTDVNPTRAGASSGHDFAINAHPTLHDGEVWVGESYPVAQLWDPSPLDGTTPLDFGDLAIPNPFPREWLADEFVTTFPVTLPMPDGSPYTLQASIGTRRTDLTSPITPAITPIRAPMIGGRDAFGDNIGVGSMPEISWQAPSTGTPTAYGLTIIEAVPNPPPPYRPGWYVTGNLWVPSDVTSVRVPADLLVDGTTYSIIFRAFAQPGQDLTARPTRSGADSAFADAIVGRFTP
jgi:hypothetical protein